MSFSKILKQLIFYFLLLAVWEFLFRLKLWPQYLFPSPGGVVSTLVNGFREGDFLKNIAVSLGRLFIGYVISVVFGVALGVLIGKVNILDETAAGLLSGLQSLPSICWLPLGTLFFGVGDIAVIGVVVLGSFLSIILATDSGIKNIDKAYLEVGKVMGAGGKDMLFHVVFPASLPAIVIGLKQGWLFAWRSLMAAEMIYSSLGLGHLLNTGRDVADVNQVVAVMLVIVFTGILIDNLVFGLVERNLRRIWGFGVVR